MAVSFLRAGGPGVGTVPMHLSVPAPERRFQGAAVPVDEGGLWRNGRPPDVQPLEARGRPAPDSATGGTMVTPGGEIATVRHHRPARDRSAGADQAEGTTRPGALERAASNRAWT